MSNLIKSTSFKVSTGVEFTEDQEKALDFLISWANAPFNIKDASARLVGSAGTGKSFVIKYLIENCKFARKSIVVSSPTHKATNHIAKQSGMGSNAKTIQALCGFQPDFDLKNFDIKNIKFIQKNRVQLVDFNLVIIDESSMINKPFKAFVMKVAEDNGVKILFVGDKCQLPPVNENRSTALEGNNRVELRQIVRQVSDNPISKLLLEARKSIEHNNGRSAILLNYLHKNKSNYSDIGGYKCLLDGMFDEKVYDSFREPEYERNIDLYRIAAYTNKTVKKWNNFVRNAIIEHNGNILCKDDLLMSYATIVDEYNSPILINSEDYIIHNISDYNNSYKGKKLKGYIVNLQQVSTGKLLRPLNVIDHAHLETLHNYYTILDSLLLKAKTASETSRGSAWKEYFNFKHSHISLEDMYDNNDNKTLLCSKSLDYGFAITTHKTQGSTYDNIFVDARDIIYNERGNMYSDLSIINRLLYVAISRCRNFAYIKI